jgi:hypothetical protein
MSQKKDKVSAFESIKILQPPRLELTIQRLSR